LNQGGDSHSVGLVVGVDAVNQIALVVLGGVVSALGAQKGRLRHVPVVDSTVVKTFNAETVGDLHFKHLDGRLLYSKVRHLNIKAVEVDTVETLVNCLGKLAFTNFLNSNSVVQSAELVELSEQVVELYKGATVARV